MREISRLGAGTRRGRKCFLFEIVAGLARDFIRIGRACDRLWISVWTVDRFEFVVTVRGGSRLRCFVWSARLCCPRQKVSWRTIVLEIVRLLSRNLAQVRKATLRTF